MQKDKKKKVHLDQKVLMVIVVFWVTTLHLMSYLGS